MIQKTLKIKQSELNKRFGYLEGLKEGTKVVKGEISYDDATRYACLKYSNVTPEPRLNDYRKGIDDAFFGKITDIEVIDDLTRSM